MELENDSAVVATDLGSGNRGTIESNGSCKNDEKIGDNSVVVKNGHNSTITEDVRSSGGDGDAEAEANRTPSSAPPPKKGYGLKKWRRIKRSDLVGGGRTDTDTDTGTRKDKEKEKEDDSDSTGRMLKRGSSNLVNENEKAGSSNSVKMNTNTILPNVDVVPSVSSGAFVAPAAPTFNAGADSDNSEDSHAHSHRSSSKSSTAATTKLRSSAKHRSQVPKPQGQAAVNAVSADTSKKSKGGLELEFERENSPLSSMDSDSICSNSVFLRRSCDRASNSVPHPPPDSSDQAQHSPPASTADAAVHSPDSSDQLSSTAANHKDHQLPDGDPLVESILMLQTAQLALQAEVQKFGEIGKGICSLCDDSDKTNGIPASMAVESDGFSESNHVYLSKIIQTLERQLDEAKGSLKEKELKIAEHEAAMRSLESSQDRARSAIEQESKRCVEMEAELLDLFKQKLEAEVQSVVITRTTKDSSVLVEGWIKLLEEQKSVSTEQIEPPRMAINTENKAAVQQGQAEKLDTLNTRILDGEESLKMRRGVVKLTICLSIQLVVLLFVLTVFVLKLGPESTVVVPT